MRILNDTSESERAAVGVRARRRVLRQHTDEHRAAELEAYLFEAGTTPALAKEAAASTEQHSY
ncbi:MAG: hypothetical protein H0V76_11140 [Blastocatellia bacterium]|nr:hypothetical protein [Blastocatellia bacterium]